MEGERQFHWGQRHTENWRRRACTPYSSVLLLFKGNLKGEVVCCQGFKAQIKMVLESQDKLIGAS